MSLCFIAPRFYPIIGGAEINLQNIAEYCSNVFNINVVTSNLVNIPKNPLEKCKFIEKRYDIISENIKIIRAKTTSNFVLRTIFGFNQYLNKKIEIFFDKRFNPHLYSIKKEIWRRQNLITLLNKRFIHQRSFANPNLLRLYEILKKVHKNQKIGIIHSSPIYLTSNIYAYRFAIKNDIKFFCTPLYHINPFADYIFYPSYQHILRNADATIACTTVEKEFYLKYGIDKNKIHIIPPGINPDAYKIVNIEDFKKKYKIPLNSPIILFMGRKSFEKGVFNLILALKYLIKSFKNIRLLIAGPHTREYESYFNKLPSKLKDHIIDLGIVDKETKTNVFASCDVFVLPSIDDAFGIVYLEAWLFKKPVIGALKGNVEGLIDDNVDGFLIPFNDVKALTSKIMELLTDDNKRIKYGEKGYKKVMENFLLEKTNEKILNLYKRFI